MLTTHYRKRFGHSAVVPSLLFLLLSGCTSLKAIEMTPEQVHEEIYAGELLHRDDRIKVVTVDGSSYRFRVRAVDYRNGVVKGNNVDIIIEDIVSLRVREFSTAKTVALGTAGWGVILGTIYGLTQAAYLVSF